MIAQREATPGHRASDVALEFDDVLLALQGFKARAGVGAPIVLFDVVARVSVAFVVIEQVPPRIGILGGEVLPGALEIVSLCMKRPGSGSRAARQTK
jgi:hypothetical protein